MLTRFFSYAGLISVMLFSSISAQEIGKIISAAEADEIFGEVVEFVEIETASVNDWLNSTTNKIMFQLKGNNFTVLADSRELVYSESEYFESDEVFHIYSKNKLLELLINGRAEITHFENREEVFTITNGNVTLEYSLPCPPYCD